MSESARLIDALLGQQVPISFEARGSSMNPTIQNGELVRARPVPAAGPRLGSVVVYHFCGRLSTHRLVFYWSRSGHAYLVADAALQGGDWVRREDIVGVIEAVRRGEYWRRLDTPVARLRGLIRFGLRPLRRVLHSLWR